MPLPNIAQIASFGRNLFRRERVERELSDELRAFVDLLTHEKVQAGMPPQQARREALLEAGGEEKLKEEVREIRAGFFFETLLQDVRYGVRMLARNPAFTTV